MTLQCSALSEEHAQALAAQESVKRDMRRSPSSHLLPGGAAEAAEVSNAGLSLEAKGDNPASAMKTTAPDELLNTPKRRVSLGHGSAMRGSSSSSNNSELLMPLRKNANKSLLLSQAEDDFAYTLVYLRDENANLITAYNEIKGEIALILEQVLLYIFQSACFYSHLNAYLFNV